jgi:hypothetical protein
VKYRKARKALEFLGSPAFIIWKAAGGHGVGVDKADCSDDGGGEGVISVSSSNKAILMGMICINT